MPENFITKKSQPSSFSKVRNISCTNFMFKVLKSFLIDFLKSEASFLELQYGGLKGAGTDNFLWKVWNNVLESLENPMKASALMSVDYLKAFNRLSHVSCLKKLAQKNASNQSITMVLAFLNGRKIKIRAGTESSSIRQVLGGSPQGTKLRNLLFCLAIDDIVHKVQDDPTARKISDFRSPEAAIPEEYWRPNATSTPNTRPSEADDSIIVNPYGFRRKLNVINDTQVEPLLNRSEYENMDTWEVGYMNDINIGEEIDLSKAIIHLPTKKEKRSVRALGWKAVRDN